MTVLKHAVVDVANAVFDEIIDSGLTAEPVRGVQTARHRPQEQHLFSAQLNTVTTMRTAVRASADVVDADVRVTRDDVLVASHDDDLASTTNGTGSLSLRTLVDLRTLDAA